ncbi:hypothetical protein PsYK624_058310 [Phanerochaete sordida]|uniref:Uncharacterized protein n=1 Tax=Phanerochaete sordida TaxID=48140 RepID=A0A9P3LBZ7_9APHY|nr:hypothetical protein PsYK624_058310 [Phanerochaete sordida]
MHSARQGTDWAVNTESPHPKFRATFANQHINQVYAIDEAGAAETLASTGHTYSHEARVCTLEDSLSPTQDHLAQWHPPLTCPTLIYSIPMQC